MKKEKTLKGKRILFFCPKFFGYEKDILNEMTQQGAIVDFFDEKPKNTFFAKVLTRLFPKIMGLFYSRYYNSILNQTKEYNYDYIFFIKMEIATAKILNKFKIANSESKFYLYLWDAVENYKKNISLFSLFDKVFSFDLQDSKRYPFLIFRPLFYGGQFIDQSEKVEAEYDIVFIGTLHSDRLKILLQIEKQCIEKQLKLFFYPYIPDKRIYFVKKMIDKSYRQKDKEFFKFKPLQKEKIRDIVLKAKAILDIEHPKQRGLTMRTAEMIGLNKSIITTNSDIINYDIYDPEKIQIVNRDLISIDFDFINFYEKKFDKDKTSKFSLNSWVKEVFTQEEN